MQKELRVFIGSSTEGARQRTRDDTELLNVVADWIEEAGHIAKRWNDINAFPATEFTLETLLGMTSRVDAAFFIFSEDEAAVSREQAVKMPRDNVLIEFGLFMGALGAKRVTAGQRGDTKLASDILGLTLIDLSDQRLTKAKAKFTSWLETVVKLTTQQTATPVLSEVPYLELIGTVKDDHTRTDVTVHALNSGAKELFGYSDRAEVNGQPANVLPTRLRDWIQPPTAHWEDFEVDQARVFRQFYAGDKTWANIPIHFNDYHPNPALKGTTFIPIIVRQQTVSTDPKRELTGVIYIHVETLPRSLFLERAWSEVSQKVNVAALTEEIKVLAKHVKDIPDFTGTPAEGPRLLARFANSGFYRLRTIAQQHQLHQIQSLLRAVISLAGDITEENGHQASAPP